MVKVIFKSVFDFAKSRVFLHEFSTFLSNSSELQFACSWILVKTPMPMKFYALNVAYCLNSSRGLEAFFFFFFFWIYKI